MHESDRAAILRRFWTKVRKTDSCWFWAASTRGRYGAFSILGKMSLAHRIAYEYVVGPVPNGMELDHKCRNRLCVNPAHLEPVTHRENCVRGEAGHHMREKAALRSAAR